MNYIDGWHFAGATLRDGSPLPKAGDTLPHIADPELCSRGWHFSETLLDALQYAPGTMLARRRGQGTVIRGDDKIVASDCTMLTSYRNVRPALVRFARRAALHALRVDAAGSLERAGLANHALKLRALPDDCNLHAAADAAHATAHATARATAYVAAYAAAYAAARAAAYTAADAAIDAANAANAAAHAAARAAAYAAIDAAHAAARKRLNDWLIEEINK